MSEQSDQPAPVEDTSATGVATEANPAPADDIDTEAFDRMPAPEEDEEDAPAGSDEGDDPDPEGKPAGGEDDETVEYELGGKTYRIPKDVVPNIMKDADYTQKTQDLAAQRRAVEAKAAELASQESQQVESLKAFRDEHMAVAQGEAALAQLDTQLADYRKLTPQDWATLRAQDPAAYQQHSDNYEFLRRTRTSTEDALEAARKDLSSKEAKLSESQQAARTAQLAKAWEETHAVLQREVKDWTPDRFKAVAKFAAEQLGYKPEELREAPDPRAWKMASQLMDAKAEIAKLQTALKQKTAAENNDKAQTVKPAERPRGNAQPRGLRDELPHDEWLRRREAQLARKRA